MTKFVPVIVVSIGLINPVGSGAQSPKSLQFEVASLKPSQSGQGFGGIRPAPGGERYVATHVTLKLMITVAYRLKDTQVSGGPAWIDTDRWDMNAKAERPSSIEELHTMLQNFLGRPIPTSVPPSDARGSRLCLNSGQGRTKAAAASGTERG